MHFLPSFLNSFIEIEEHKTIHAEALSQKPPLLYSLSQNVQASQLPPVSFAMTQKSWGVAPKKLRAQLDMESQQRAKAL